MELCTQCHRDGRKVEHVSALSVVDYYRCPRCGTIWTVPKESAGRDDKSQTPLLTAQVHSRIQPRPSH